MVGERALTGTHFISEMGELVCLGGGGGVGSCGGRAGWNGVTLWRRCGIMA